MIELIKITESNGKQAVSARELHSFLESKQDFSTWIKNRIEKYDLIENVDYQVFHNFMENPKGGRPLTEYALSVSAAKELSMVEGNEKGKQARKYFISCENQLREYKSPTPVKPITIKEKCQVATWLIETLNLNNSSKLLLAKTIADPLGLPTPDYTPSKGQLLAPTTLLQQNGINISTQEFNKKMIEAGFIKEVQRPSSKVKIKYFKSLTDKGAEFGENQVNPNNPKETQPLYYSHKFSELLGLLQIA